MELIQDYFAEELTDLLRKHNVSLSCDKEGIFVLAKQGGDFVVISRATCASESTHDRLIFVAPVKEN